LIFSILSTWAVVLPEGSIQSTNHDYSKFTVRRACLESFTAALITAKTLMNRSSSFETTHKDCIVGFSERMFWRITSIFNGLHIHNLSFICHFEYYTTNYSAWKTRNRVHRESGLGQIRRKHCGSLLSFSTAQKYYMRTASRVI